MTQIIEAVPRYPCGRPEGGMRRLGDQPPLPYGRVMISSQCPSGPSQ
jgi:hypothetical protein